MNAWNGVWTEELLRELTVGSTRFYGEIKVLIGFFNEKIVANRNWDGLRYTVGYAADVIVDGIETHAQRELEFTPRDAVNYLNDALAVPVNADGRTWKVVRRWSGVSILYTPPTTGD